ncbi:MAG: hypothetical protein KAS82_03455 [Bacteroidales bacterium]|nr:hypothetical protein [Bacteroidales bacterium]
MIQNPLPLFVSLLIVFSFNLPGQEVGESGFEPEEWSAIQQRWRHSQPVIMISTDSGTQYSGQPIHAAIDTLYLFPATGLPVGPDWYSKVLRIPFSDIDKILLQKGGNRVTRAHKSVSLQVPKTDKYFTPPFQAVRKASVYSDSLVQEQRLEDAFPHSKVLRQAFPDKHVRISFGLGFGGDRATGDAESALRLSQLPDSYGSYGNSVTVDLLDLSWRFRDRLIVGGQLLARCFSSSLYGNNFGEYGGTSYQYDIYFFEHRLYAEYAFFHLDRYFTRKYELLTGVGFLMGKPEWSIYYNYDDFSDPDYFIYDEVKQAHEGYLKGFQLRSAFHYYFFPGFSLWTGLEVNLYKPWVIEAVEWPTSDPDASISLQEHTLNFSGVRFKFGIGIYL